MIEPMNPNAGTERHACSNTHKNPEYLIYGQNYYNAVYGTIRKLKLKARTK